MIYGDFDTPEIPDDLFECAILLKNNIIGLTIEGGSELEYKLARRKLMEDPASKRLLPEFVRFSNDAASVRSALSSFASGAGSWAIRRGHVVEAFSPLLIFLESGGGAADAAITNGLGVYDAPAIQTFWAKALDRRMTDPDGAVTAASTLLEEVCKHIIEDSGGKWETKWSVPKLYAEASKVLKIAPSQHQEEVFKTILGNCQSVVQSIGSLRNKGGDAHAGGALASSIQAASRRFDSQLGWLHGLVSDRDLASENSGAADRRFVAAAPCNGAICKSQNQCPVCADCGLLHEQSVNVR